VVIEFIKLIFRSYQYKNGQMSTKEFISKTIMSVVKDFTIGAFEHPWSYGRQCSCTNLRQTFTFARRELIIILNFSHIKHFFSKINHFKKE